MLSKSKYLGGRGRYVSSRPAWPIQQVPGSQSYIIERPCLRTEQNRTEHNKQKPETKKAVFLGCDSLFFWAFCVWEGTCIFFLNDCQAQVYLSMPVATVEFCSGHKAGKMTCCLSLNSPKVQLLMLRNVWKLQETWANSMLAFENGNGEASATGNGEQRAAPRYCFPGGPLTFLPPS